MRTHRILWVRVSSINYTWFQSIDLKLYSFTLSNGFYKLLLIAKAEANNLLTVKFTSRSRICLVMIVTSIDFFKILIIYRWFFLSIILLNSPIFISGITTIREKLRIQVKARVGPSLKIFLISFHLLNPTFFDTALLFSFLM